MQRRLPLPPALMGRRLKFLYRPDVPSTRGRHGDIEDEIVDIISCVPVEAGEEIKGVVQMAEVRGQRGGIDERLKTIALRIVTLYAPDQKLSDEDASRFDLALTVLERHRFHPSRKRNGKLSFTKKPNLEDEQYWYQCGRTVATKSIEEHQEGTQGWNQLLASIAEQEQIVRDCQQVLYVLEQQPRLSTWKDILELHESRYVLKKELTYAEAVAHRYERESAKY